MHIYKFYRYRWTEAWQRLPDAERMRILNQVDGVRDQVGGHIILACESGWSNEAWHTFGVEEFPCTDAVRTYQKLLEELNWFTYVQGESMLGTNVDGGWLTEAERQIR